MSSCVFCDISDSDRVLRRNEHALLFGDRYPVTQGHSLVIPRRCVADYFSLSETELLSINRLLFQRREELLEEDPSISGFNVGVNCGGLAGQTVFHCHVHLIPRRLGDVEDPVGGVRNTIPGKGNYRSGNWSAE